MKLSSLCQSLFLATATWHAGLFCASAAPVPPTDNTSQPFFGTYEWSLSTSGFVSRNAFTCTWLNRSQIWAEDFAATDTWDNLRGPSWLLNPASTWIAANPARKYILSVGLLPGPVSGSGPSSGIGAGVAVSLEQGAAGNYNTHWQVLAQNLVAKGLANNTILRLGWEFNGGWYTWKATTQAKGIAYAGYWRQIVNTMRAVPGATNLKFCWNGNNNWNEYSLADAYPGDAYVDYIGPDLYDQSWAANTYPYPAGATPAEILQRQQNAWTSISGTSNNGLAWWKNFAVAHGKPLVIPEWGCWDRNDNHGGLDNPYYVQKMYDFIQEPANNVYFHVYFNVSGSDGPHQLTAYGGYVTPFPNAAALFQQLFRYNPPAAIDIIKDNTDSGVGLVGTWTPATTLAGFYGSNYLHDGNTESKSVTYNVTIPAGGTGSYKVYARWVNSSTNNTWVPYTVTHAAGDSVVNKNQTWGGGSWQLLGTWNFNAGATAKVKISNAGAGTVIADAVRFTKQ